MLRTASLRPGLAALLLAALALAGCSVKSDPVRAVGLSRETPRKTYEYMKAMVAAMQVEAEWRTFSPGFKRRLSERVGRNVDVGDYSHARATIAGNDTKEIELLLESEYVSEEFLSEDVAVVTIRSGSRQARPRMVRLTTWELTLRGEGEPVSEFIPRAADVVGINADGSVAVRVTPTEGTASFLKEIPADRIESLVVKPDWYVDDFGGIEESVLGGLKGAGSDRGDAEPRPAPPPAKGPEPAPRPAWPPQPPPSPDGDPGSPG